MYIEKYIFILKNPLDVLKIYLNTFIVYNLD